MKLFFIIISIFCITSVYGQDWSIKVKKGSGKNPTTISGKIVDGYNRPLPFAHIILTNVETEKQAKTISQDDGSFLLKTTSGEYYLSISMLGFKKLSQKINILSDTDLETIVLHEENTELDEVVINKKIAKKITHTANGMTFDIKNDTLLNKKPIAEILSYLPGLRVDDQEGTINMIGKNTIMILIDGKSTRVSVNMLFRMLESMTGERLDNVEIIQTPSAKYSGRIEGIVNINLKKQRDNGLLGGLNARYSNDQSIRPGLFMDYKANSFVFSGGVSGLFYNREVTNYTEQEFLDSSVLFISSKENTNKMNSLSYNFGVDYELNKKHSFSTGFSIGNRTFKTKSNLYGEQYANIVLDSIYTNTLNTKNPNITNTYDFSYRYDIADKHRLDFAMRFSNISTDTDKYYNTINTDITGTNSAEQQSRDLKKEKNDVMSFRLDYALPTKKKNSFEIGAKYDAVDINNNNSFDDYNNQGMVWETDLDLSNVFNYKEQVLSGYLNTASNHNRFKYSLGLRVEQILTKSVSPTIQQEFNNTYTQLLPVVSLKYATNKARTNSIGVSFKKLYNLPSYTQLNPFEFYVNDYTLQKGNPSLKPELIYRYTLSYTHNNKYFFNYNYAYVTNSFSQVTTQEDNSAIISYQNIGERILHHANLGYQKASLFKWWAVYPSLGVAYTKIENDLITTNATSANIELSNIFSLPQKFTINGFLAVNTNSISGISKRTGGNVFGKVNVSKRILNDKGTINFGVLDIFNARNNNTETYTYDGVRNVSRSSGVPNPQITFGFSYRFTSGKAINKKEKKKSNINEDRLK